MRTTSFKLAFLILLLFTSIAQAAPEVVGGSQGAKSATEKRLALIVGNGRYTGAPLKNPANDARDMSVALRRLGFEVIERVDVTQKEFNRAITQFGERLTSDTVALFFFAGHGIQVKGKNYLIPIDAEISQENSIRAEAVDVDAILDQLAVSSVNIVILDACRNNPFERRFRSVGGGLSQMDAPKGTLIAYATSPGKVASDGDGRNGLYTQELLQLIRTPGLPLEQVFKKVRVNVAKATGEAQIPWESSSLTGDFYFIPTPSEAEARKKEKEELLQVIENQKASADRAVEEALRKARDQAVEERALLKQSMEKMLEEALARQAVQLEKERQAQAAAKPPIAAAAQVLIAARPEKPAATALFKETAASPGLEGGEKLASIAPSQILPRPVGPELARPVVPEVATEPPEPAVGSMTDMGNPQAGDEWEYSTLDHLFGVKHTLVQRVKALANSGVLVESLLDGRNPLEWAYSGNPLLTATATESEVLFGPYWNEREDEKVGVLGAPLCVARICNAFKKVLGTERISVRAGSFDTVKLEVQVHVFGSQSVNTGVLQQTVWYSSELKRAIKQRTTSFGFSGSVRIDETIELSSFRRATK